MSDYMKSYIRRLEKQHGKAFIDQLYEALKDDRSIYEAQLPPNPLFTVRPEHDIRSRAPRYYAENVAQPIIQDTGFYGRQPKYGPDTRSR
jgi:hypothetical protein